MVAKFWGGGSGNWSDAGHWFLATGSGGGGTTVPTSADTVTFDGGSGGGTVTIDAAVNILSLTTGAFTGTLDFSAGNAVALGANGWSNTGTGARTITMGATVVTVTSSGANPWLWTTTTSCTFTAGTSEIIFAGGSTGALRSIPLGSTGLTFNKITLNTLTSGFHSTAFGYTVSAVTINTLTINAGNWLEWPSSPTLNVGTLVMTGTSSTPCMLAGATVSTSSTMALTNASTADWACFRDCTFTGSTVTASNSLNLGRNSGATITPPSGGGGGGSFGMVGG